MGSGIRDQPKHAGLVQWLRSLPVSVDIVCLQEMHFLLLSECSLWFQSSGFSCALSCGSVHSCGCIVLFRPSLSFVNSWVATMVVISNARLFSVANFSSVLYLCN